MEVFLEMVKRNMIYRQLRPVHWSPSTKTALAEAELEYKDDHASTAVYVKFPLVEIGTHFFVIQLMIGGLTVEPEDKVYAIIWTTTPWTLPANRVTPLELYLTVGNCNKSIHALSFIYRIPG